MHGSLHRRTKFAAAAAVSLVLAAPVASAAASTAPAAPSVAVGPNQYFIGVVHGTTSTGPAGATIIGVACAGPASSGHPLAGQSVEVDLVIPPVSATTGYTGTLAKGIAVYLVWPSATTPPISTTVKIGVLTTYSTLLAIPVTLTVPCSGAGQTIFSPAPASQTSKTSVVPVNFRSTGV